MLHTENTVYTDHTKHINTLCGQM